MKAAVVYYSFKGNSKFVADELSKSLGVKAFRLVPSVEPPQKGLGMFLKGGGMALKKMTPELEDLGSDLSEYDTIILCAPVWAGTYPPAVGAFLKKYDISKKSLVLVSASASGNGDKMMDAIASDSKANVIARVSLTNPLRKQEECRAKLASLVEQLRG